MKKLIIVAGGISGLILAYLSYFWIIYFVLKHI